MFCAIWYHLYNLKNGGVLLLALKVTLLHGCFSRFLNCTNGTKSRNAPHMYLAGTCEKFERQYVKCGDCTYYHVHFRKRKFIFLSPIFVTLKNWNR